MYENGMLRMTIPQGEHDNGLLNILRLGNP
jgi:hypothetical protein